MTKLSLLLKVLEEETGQLTLGFERALPDLSDNIKCGNSLIGWDYFEGQLLPDEEEVARVNPFDWERAFPTVFEKGGFDAVIGNPPYIRIQAMKEWAPGEVEFYKEKYISASKGNYDIYVVFVEKGLDLLSNDGNLGFILPHKFFSSKYGEPLRDLIIKGNNLKKVVHFGDHQIFKNATTYTCLLFLVKMPVEVNETSRINDLTAWQSGKDEGIDECKLFITENNDWNLILDIHEGIVTKLSRFPKKLGDLAEKIFQGLITGADSVFILNNLENGKYHSKNTNEEHFIEDELMHPLCKGSVNIRRYMINDLEKSILFPYTVSDNKAELISAKVFSSKFPNAWEYLQENRNTLEMREHGKWKHEKWYAFGRNQNLTEMNQKKILTPSIASFSSFMLDNDEHYFFVGSGGGGGGGYGITFPVKERIAYEYFLGLLNSRLLDFYLKTYSSQFSGGYYAYNKQYIERLPIRIIDFMNKDESAIHDKMVNFVRHMLELHKRTHKTPFEQERLAREIAATDAQIDRLVYDLYGLTEEEIKIVEGEG